LLEVVPQVAPDACRTSRQTSLRIIMVVSGHRPCGPEGPEEHHDRALLRRTRRAHASTHPHDLVLRPQSLIHIHGKGRRERCLPLWKETVGVLRAWLAVRGESAGPELFPNSNGTGLTRSGFAYILRKYVTAAREQCPSVGKKRVSPHVLRHTCAINALGATQDVRKVALWLGHASIETTEVYLQTDPRQKLDTIDAILPATLRRGRFRAPDKLIAALTPAKRTRATRPTAARVMRSGRRKGSR